LPSGELGPAVNIKKTAVVIAAIVLSETLARANLIDLTPGGFDLTKPLPTVVQDFFGRYGIKDGTMQNLAGANIVNGQPVWSPFTLFNNDHFGLTLNADGTGAEVNWNLIGTGFHSLFVFVESSALIANLYLVPGQEQFVGDGFVEVNGTIPIAATTFTGTDHVPDTGSTLAMLSIAIGILGLYRHAFRHEGFCVGPEQRGGQH
jgi:hypothetical protein